MYLYLPEVWKQCSYPLVTAVMLAWPTIGAHKREGGKEDRTLPPSLQDAASTEGVATVCL